MNRRQFLTGLGATGVGAAATIGCRSAAGPKPAARAAPGQTKPPNVILIMTDDQGYGDLACHGNPHLKTPNLDRLHADSTRLTNFHVDPTCSPTRSALMTGRYSSRTGVWHTIMGRSLLRADEVTVADAFAAGGYRTAIFGKWHLGDNYPFRAEDRGFQESIVCGGGGVGQTPDFWGNDYFDDTYWHNGTPEKFKGYCTDVFFAGATRFIEANKDRPFFVYIPTNAAHGPYNVAEKYSKPYADMGVGGGQAKFYGMITNIDENVGRLRKRLAELALEENTIFIFMTDNGTAAGPAGGMRGKKGSEYEGGHRVPFFIRWPAGLKARGDIPQLTAHIDLLPTLIDLCGVEPPKNVTFDGTSIAPLLRDKGDWPDRTLVVHSQRIEHPQKWRKSAVMTDRWRLVGGKELYDPKADPAQKKDLAADHPDVVKQLRKAYDHWWADHSGRFGEYCRIVLGSDKENPSRLTSHDWHTANVPWAQGHIRNHKMFANGPWAVEVSRGGRYEFTLYRAHPEAKFALAADEAKLKIGDVEVVQPADSDATSVTLAADLKPGKAMLQTWLTDKATGKSRGAYVVMVKRLAT